MEMAQIGARISIDLVHNQFQPDKKKFSYNQFETHIYTDIFLADNKSLIGNTFIQIVTTRFVNYIFSLMKKGNICLSTLEIVQEVWVSTYIHTEKSRELNLVCWKEICWISVGIKTTATETNLPYHNRSEQVLKKEKRKVMSMSQNNASPRKFYYFSTVYMVDLRSMNLFTNEHFKYRTPHELFTGYMPNIIPEL